VSGPAVALSDSSSLSATFTAPEVDEELVLVFQLTATDDDNATASDQVRITVSDTSAPPTTGTITGAVEGTTIMAVNGDGRIIALNNTAGRQPDVDVDNDGIADWYSFELAQIPLDTGIRVFLVDRGNIYPLYFDTDADGQTDTNVFALTTEAPLALGTVDTQHGYFWEEGRAIPANSPAGDPTVIVGSTIARIPLGVNDPPTDGYTLSQLVDKGLDALYDGWVLGARTYLEAAVDLAGGDTSNDADSARFLLALTRVTAVGFDTLSDGNTADMNRLGDILDELRVPNNETRANWELLEVPSPLPSDSPTGGEYQDFLYAVLRAELIAAVANLDAVSESFNLTWTDPMDTSTTVESDYSDVLVFRGLFKGGLTGIATQKAYFLDGDIDEIQAANNDADPGNDVTIENYLALNGDFLSLIDTSKLAEAKSYLVASALDDFDAAIDSILAEQDDQSDDLVTIDPSVDDPGQAKTWIAETKNSLLVGATQYSNSELTLDLKHFFDVGVDFRRPAPGLIPPFSANDVAGLFPDPTFDGVVLTPNLNEDTNPPDGIPDILQ
jgi:hypothetical protein